MTDLKPCPFCATEPNVEPWHGGPSSKRRVGCENEDCDVQPSVCGDTYEIAARRWNTRKSVVTDEMVERALDRRNP